MCRTRSRRTRAELVSRLSVQGIDVGVPPRLAGVDSDLNLSRQFVRRHRPQYALAVLAEIEKRLDALEPNGRIRYRFYQQRAAAYLQLGRSEDALQLAKRALDHDSNGVHALIVAGLAAMNLGDMSSALHYGTKATTVAPDDPLAWGCMAQIASNADQPIPPPPLGIATSQQYREALIQVELNSGNVETVVTATDALLREGVRTGHVLVCRAEALITTAAHDVTVMSAAIADEVERLTTDAIEECQPSDDVLRRALLARALARRAIGRVEEGNRDVEQARELQPDDPQAILEAAQIKIIDGDYDGARRLLTGLVVEQFPLLLALRAFASASLGERDTARRDIDEALRRIGQAHEPNAVRLAAADAAIQLPDATLAERCLAGLSRESCGSARYRMIRGRLAFAMNDQAAAIVSFEAAAACDATLRAGCYAELGSRLLQSDAPAEAVRAFEKSDPLPLKAVPQYVQALVRANHLVTADEIVARHLSEQCAPDWAVEAAAQIAIAREDTDTAARQLLRLCDRRSAVPAARLQLASLLIELERVSEARPIVDALLAEVERLSPHLRMGLARLLFGMGDRVRSLDVAFTAFRLADDDPEMHRGLAVLALNSEVPVEAVPAVGPNTFARFRHKNTGETKQYVVFSQGPVNAAASQILVPAAEALNILGLKLGEYAALGDWYETPWELTEVKPALQHIVQDILAHFEDRFPDAPFFVRGFSIGGQQRVADFAPMIDVLHKKAERRDTLVRLYRDRVLPLGFLAEASGSTIAEAIAYLRTDSGGGTVLVEWSDSAGQQQSLAAVAQSDRVVLAESALDAAYRLDLLDSISGRFSLICPTSLRVSLHTRLRELEKMVERGHQVISTDGPGLRIHEWPAGDPTLVEQRDRIRALTIWLDSKVTFEARPLESVEADSERSSGRELIGQSSFDSLALARYRRATLYADDLGLRGFGLHMNVPSFATPSLVVGLGEAGVLSPDSVAHRLLQLVLMRFVHVPLTLDLSKRIVGTLKGEALVQALSANLLPPVFTPQDGGRLGAQTLRWVSTEAILSNTVATITRQWLEAMAVHWPKRLCSYVLLRAAIDELSLLPQALDVVKGVCTEFAKPQFVLTGRQA